ncbi:MAG: HepT-like ribonuclease domain-containing protein [Acidimicrobiales bacterium]
MDAIGRHTSRGDLSDDFVFDAVRVRLIEIGEATKLLDSDVTSRAPEIRWPGPASMRDRLTHHYFDTSLVVVRSTVVEDLPVLDAAVRRVLAGLDDAGAPRQPPGTRE